MKPWNVVIFFMAGRNGISCKRPNRIQVLYVHKLHMLYIHMYLSDVDATIDIYHLCNKKRNANFYLVFRCN